MWGRFYSVFFPLLEAAGYPICSHLSLSFYSHLYFMDSDNSSRVAESLLNHIVHPVK